MFLVLRLLVVLVLVVCDTLDSLYIDMVNKSSCFAVVSMMNNHTKKDMNDTETKTTTQACRLRPCSPMCWVS